MKKQKTKFKQTEIGKIPEDWEVKTFGDLGNVITGKTPKTSEIKNFGNDYPFITPRDMQGQKHIISTERYLSEMGKESVVGSFLPAGSVCVSCIGSDMGKVIMTSQESITNQQINSIIPINNNPDFVYYSLIKDSKKIKSLGKQSTAIPILNKSQFSSLEIVSPKSKEEQKAIAKILSSLDEKIELNNKMNKTLEAIGQAIFKKWFVEGKKEGWEKGKLGEIVDCINGVSYKSSELKNSRNALVTLKSINRGGGFNQKGYKEYSGEFKESQILTKGDFVVAKTDLTQNAEVVGRPALIIDLGYYEKLIASLDLQIIRPKEKTIKWFIYYLLKTEDFHNHALSYVNGTTVLHLGNGAVQNYKITLPDKKTLDRFNELTEKIIDRIQVNEKQSQTLSQIRDSLLPKLMCGEVRVR